MADLYLNTQINTQNLQTNLHLSGIHSIINKKSNVIMCNDNITGSIIADSSNIIIDDITNISSIYQNVIFSTNNSKVTRLSGQINVNNNNGSMYNYNNPSGNIPISQVNGIDQLTTQTWNPYLVNDGNKFIWYETQRLNDYYIVNNTGQTIIVDKIIGAQAQKKFNKLLSGIPKNLYGKTLIINCPQQTEMSNNLIVSGFYNGTVKILADYLGTRNLQCINIQHLQITASKNADGIPTKTSISKCIRLQNIESCTINDLLFFGNSVNTIDNITNIYNYNYAIERKNIINDFKLYIINSNVVLSNNLFDICNQTNVYCTLNSKLTAYCNTFNFSSSNDFQRRPICYYISKNSFCTACKDTVIINYNITDGYDHTTSALIYNTQQPNNTQQLNNSISKQIEKYKNVLESDDNDKKTFIYGFAYPGSFFNHEHKSKLLKRSDVKNADLIENKQLPLGSIYQIPNKIASSVLTGNTQYSVSSTIGYHICNSPSTYIGISYNSPIPGYFTYKIYKQGDAQTEKQFKKTVDALERQTTKLNQIHEFSNNIIFPQPTLQRRYKGKYSENIKYSQIMRHHFYLNTCPYFNMSLLSAFFQQYEERPLLASIPSALYGSIPKDSANRVKLAIQYNQFVNYDKTIFKTNIED